MTIEDKDIKIERITGSGPGGQHRNKTASCVRLTHLPSGVTVRIDGRNQHANLREARKELQRRLTTLQEEKQAEGRKERRDEAIKPTATVRTYSFPRGTVTDHRTGKKASIKDVLQKGRIDLVAPQVGDSQQKAA